MKINSLKILFSLLLSTVMLFSCKKEDDIHISDLEGTWKISEYGKDVKYTFNNPGKTVLVYALQTETGADTTLIRNYIVSNDKRILTIFEGDRYQKSDALYTGQYYLKELSSKQMIWENTDKELKEADKTLFKK